MLFWFLLALMTGAAIFSVLWPLSLRRNTSASTGTDADVAVYRDQLSELERDSARGLIGSAEAEAARVEIARRLIAASGKSSADQSASGSLSRRRIAAMAALIGIPVLALSLYLIVGSPEVPSLSSGADSNRSSGIDSLLSRVENHLAEKPDDGRGWEILAPIYLRLGRTADAVKARENALRLLGETAERQADFGEALVADANGVVTVKARTAFERAAMLDPRQPKARFFLGLAAEQDGRKKDAETIWRELEAGAPFDATWLPAVRAGLERLKKSETPEKK